MRITGRDRESSRKAECRAEHFAETTFSSQFQSVNLIQLICFKGMNILFYIERICEFEEYIGMYVYLNHLFMSTDCNLQTIR